MRSGSARRSRRADPVSEVGERKRKLLVIVPATLRAQWEQELDDKFHLPSVVLESRSFNRLSRGHPNPFERPGQVVLCSYQFAAAKQAEISRVPWDLVVIDEAHRLATSTGPATRRPAPSLRA